MASPAGGTQAIAPDAAEAGRDRRLRPFDFRNPSKMGRDELRRLELTHDTFARTMGTALSSRLRTLVRFELLAVDQMIYDELIRSMPNPTVIAQLTMDPLPGTALLEMSTSSALTLVDRLLGGIGRPGLLRRPTELESALITDLVRHAEGALAGTFEPVLAIEPALRGIEFNPNFVQAANPPEMVVVMSYSMSILEGHRSEGLVTLTYPAALLTTAWELEPATDSPRPALSPGSIPNAALAASLPDLSVPLAARLRSSDISAADLDDLRPGDVITLDHGVDEPVIGVVEGSALVEGRLGRKGKNMALEITQWRTS